MENFEFAISVVQCKCLEGEDMEYRPEYDLKVIGNNLKRLRLGKGLSVDEVRKYLRLGTRQAIYKYESGMGYPQADTMFALMELYGADLHDIVDEHMETDGVLDNAYDVGMEPQQVISVKEHRKKQIERMRRYAELLREYYKVG